MKPERSEAADMDPLDLVLSQKVNEQGEKRD